MAVCMTLALREVREVEMTSDCELQNRPYSHQCNSDEIAPNRDLYDTQTEVVSNTKYTDESESESPCGRRSQPASSNRKDGRLAHRVYLTSAKKAAHYCMHPQLSAPLVCSPHCRSRWYLHLRGCLRSYVLRDRSCAITQYWLVLPFSLSAVVPPQQCPIHSPPPARLLSHAQPSLSTS